MVVPHSYLVALLMTVLTMACWGSWANVVKLVKNWRFELLYFDYALGILLTSSWQDSRWAPSVATVCPFS